MYLILVDGTKLNHIGATGTTKYIQGANRDTITFIFDDTKSVDELDALFNETNCEVINIVTEEDVVVTEEITKEDGSVEYVEHPQTVYTDNYHYGYVIRESISKKISVITPATGTTPEVTETQIHVTMAQRTYAETQIANLTETVDVLVLESLMA